MELASGSYKQAVASIDLGALKHNALFIKHHAPQSTFLAMIKSNAYGHGLIPVAKALSDIADYFGVAGLDEAIKLRTNGTSKPILLLKGILTPEELALASSLHLSIMIHHFHQIELLEQAILTNPVSTWIKIDTGMHRLGFQPNQVALAYNQLIACPNVTTPLHFVTHFSDSDMINNPKTGLQIACFKTATAGLEGISSLANSGAILNKDDFHGNIVRSGILLYGASPYSDKTGVDLGLQPVMTLSSKILAIQHLHQGDQIGYGSTWTCPEDMPIGIVNMGYSSGYPRLAKNGTPILVNNVRCPLVGRVSMEMITVDLRPHPQAKIGDPVTLWGQGLPVEEIAHCAGTISYELLAGLTQNVHFEYCEELLNSKCKCDRLLK